MRLMVLGSWLVAVVVLAPVSSLANTILVPDDYPTIQGAIDAAVNGDTILVIVGTFQENLDFKGKTLSLTSYLGAANTFLDAGGNSSAIKLVSGEGPTLIDGFTIRNGLADEGGAILCRSVALTVKNCVFQKNKARIDGGSVSASESSSIDLENCTVSDGSAPIGAGLFLDHSTVTLRSCTLARNIGEALHVVQGDLVVENCSLHDNVAIVDGAGGGISVIGGSVSVQRSGFILNAGAGPSGAGAGAVFLDGATGVLADNTMSDNYCGVGTGGGTIFLRNCTLDLLRNSCFRSTNGLAAVMVDGGGGSIVGNLISLTRGPPALGVSNAAWSIENNSITRNKWGGINLVQSSSSLVGNVIDSNEAEGGISCLGGAPVLVNDLITQNWDYEQGGGISCYGAQVTILSCTVWGNFSGDGDALYLDDASSAVLRNDIFFSNGHQEIVGSHVTATYCDIESGYPGTGNIDENPLFAYGSFRLLPASPCLDSGSPSDHPAGRDVYGQPRFLAGDLANSMRIDMGAAEFDNVALAIAGQPSPGQTMTITTTGTPGLSLILLVGTSDGEVLVRPYGPVFFSLAAPWIAVPFGTIPGIGTVSVDVTVPDVPVPLRVIVQEVALASLGDSGNVSNDVALTIE